MADEKPTDRSFHVRLAGVDGPNGFGSGHDTQEEAEKSAAERNVRAETLGVKARYVAVLKPA